MKFGKNIGRVVELSDPEWSPFWMNYKFLKKKVKALGVPSAKLDITSNLRCDPQALAQSAGEVEFYKLLRQELRKCSEFFTSVESQLMVRQARVMEGWRQLLLPNVIVDGNPGKRLMAACVKLYKDLLLLEHFAIMNYCGFSKILKKHDKVTGFRTRESFMKNVVNPAPFVEYRQLIEKLSSVEALFKDIENLPSATAEAGTRVPLQEEQLFIDTMLTINTEAFRLQQEEGADLGLNTPEFSHKRDSLPRTTSVISGITTSKSIPGNGLDMVAAAAAHVVARTREVSIETKDSAAKNDKKAEPGRATVDAAPVATTRSNGEVATLMRTGKETRGSHSTDLTPAKRLCTSSR